MSPTLTIAETEKEIIEEFALFDSLATIYSALGIDWTKQIDTPFGRTFEYVPFAGAGTYAPIDELWG